MKKRLLSILLALMLITVSTPSMAENAIDSSGEVVFDPTVYDRIELVDFSDGTYGTIKATDYRDVAISPKAYGNAESSILYTFGSSDFDSVMSLSLGEIKALFPDISYRSKAVVKLRFYSENVGNKFTICFGENGITGTASGYSHATVEVKDFGWQEFQIPFSKILGTDMNWKYFRINSTGWVNNPKNLPEGADPYWTKGDPIYFDSLWFERIPTSFVAADAPLSDAYVLDGMASYGNNDTRKATATSNYTTNLRPGGAPSYTMVNITDSDPDFYFELKKDGSAPSVDQADYKFLNMWIYSPRPQSGGIGVRFRNATPGKRTLAVSLDWTGWKLVSVDVDSRLTDNASVSNKVGSINKIQIIAGNSYTIGINKWDSEKNAFNMTEYAINKGFWNNWDGPGQFGIESAWFSVTKPDGANVRPGSTELIAETPVEASDDEWVAFDIANGVITNTDRMNYYSGLGHLYSGAAEISDNIIGQRYIETTLDSDGKLTQAVFRRAGKNTKTTKKNEDGSTETIYTIAEQYTALFFANNYADRKDVVGEGYKYINLWLYSPGVQLDQFGNYSEYVLCINGWTSTTTNKRVGVGIPANWTGWKLISIPLDEMAKANPAWYDVICGGVRRVELLGNVSEFCNDWPSQGTSGAYPASKTIKADTTGTHTLANIAPDFGDSNEKTNLSRVVDGDYEFGVPGQGDFNTFCSYDATAAVERVWFSKEVPAEKTNAITSDVLTVEGNAIKGYGGMTLSEVRNALIADSGTELTFRTSSGEAITDETKPALKGMILVSTYKNVSVTYTFSTELLEIDDVKFYMNGEETSAAFDIGTLEAKTNVTCFNKNASPDLSLILAQYEGNKLINVNFDPKTVINARELSTSIELEKVSGTSLSVFLWNSLTGVKPVKKPLKLDIGKYLWMPSVFASGSVMQRDTELNIWGEAAPGSEVSVTLGGSIKTTVAADDGSWELVADPITVDGNPYTMTVTTSGGGKLEFTDILAGEVWLCSGQSNMEWQMYRIVNEGAYDDIKAQVSADIVNSVNSNIRLYNQTRNYSSEVMKDTIDGKWQECNSTNVNNFSAVAYYFGKNLEQQLDVPVGLISAARGGTAIQCFLDPETLAENNITYTHETDPQRFAGSVFNSMVAPIIPYTIKGVLWYQGCSNSSADADTKYYDLQNIWLSSWRNLWDDADMPFVITQIAAVNTANYELVREAQYKFATDNQNVEMAVTYDVGEKNQVHYCDKITAGYRLALAAAGGVYGHDIAWKYPSPEGFTVDGTTLTLTFKDVYDGLKLKDGDTELNSFEILTSDGTWVPAEAEITGTNTVTVTDGTNIPVGVRAGFKPYAEPMYNLYNSADLLATPFRLVK